MSIFSARTLSADDDIPKGAKLALSLTEALANEQDVKKGLEEFTKGQLDDWMWDSIGGYEKLITGQLDDVDAVAKQAKDKINKALEIINSISEFATNMGAGKYDDALFNTIDAAVTVIDHPVVKTVWAMAKMTYESHKLVQETGAELQIETLYGIVSNDRRLLGSVDPGSDQPRLIPETASSADYFFEKYLITNDQVRGLVKTYVQKVLGDAWPEQTWSQWFSNWQAIGSGVDTTRSAEIEALDTEFRNKARGWIMQLIKDVNKQAKVAWAQARMRQEMVEFQAFAKRLSAFNVSLPELIKSFQSKKEYRKNLPVYQKYLTDSPRARQEAMGNLTNPAKLRMVQDAINLWKGNLIGSSSAAFLIGETKLSDSLKEELKAWYKLEDEFDKRLPQVQDKVAQNPTEVFPPPTGKYPITSITVGEAGRIVTTVVCTLEDVLGYYSTHFASILMPFDDWEEDAEKIKKQMNEVLNSGNFKEADEIKNRWLNQSIKIGEYYKEVRQKLDKAIMDNEATLTERERKITKGEQLAFAREKASFQGAKEIANQVYSEITWATDAIYSGTASEIAELYSAFDNLRKTSLQQWNQYSALIDEMKLSLPIYAVTGVQPDVSHIPLRNYRNPSECIKFLDEDLKFAKENIHTMIVPFERDGDIYSLASRVQMLADSLLLKETSNPEAIYSEYDKWIPVWQDAAKKWKNAPMLTEKQLQQIEVLVHPDKQSAESGEKPAPLDFAKLKKEIKLIEQTASSVPALVAQTKTKLTELAKILDTDRENRLKDGEWLAQKAKEIKAFFKDQVSKGLLRVGEKDYEINLRIGMDNMAIVETPFRHYADENELREYTKAMESEWNKYPIMSFIKQYAPGQYEKMRKLAIAQSIKRAPEENFIPVFFSNDTPIWKSSLRQAKALIASIKPDLDKEAYDLKIAQLAKMLPQTIYKDDKLLAGYVLSDNFKLRKEYLQHPMGEQYIELCKKIEALLEERLGYLREVQAAKDKERVEKESRKTQEELAKKQEDEMRQQLAKEGRLAEFYSLWINDSRLNTISLNKAFGDVVLTNAELRQGEIQITGMLSTLDRVEKIIISEDNGITWKELPHSQNISYSFMPLPDKPYQPVLKIKTTDFQEVLLKFFPNINSIVYKNVDYDDLILETIKRIAEAYETQNVNLFSDYISHDYLGNKTFLVEGVRFDFDLFTDIRLTIYINRVERRADMFVVETKWDKTQTPRKTGQQQRTSGRTTMTLVLEDGKMKIKNLRGNLIYATLSPEIAQASGLSQTIIDEIRQAQEDRNPVQPGADQTEESGGVSSVLTVQNVELSAPGWPGQGYDFTANTTVSPGSGASDADFESNLVFGFQFQQIFGQSFDALNTAPADGYGAGGLPTDAGNVFAFITKEGYYGKMVIVSSTDMGGGVFNLTFRFAVQTDGSTNLRTQ